VCVLKNKNCLISVETFIADKVQLWSSILRVVSDKKLVLVSSIFFMGGIEVLRRKN